MPEIRLGQVLGTRELKAHLCQVLGAFEQAAPFTFLVATYHRTPRAVLMSADLAWRLLQGRTVADPEQQLDALMEASGFDPTSANTLPSPAGSPDPAQVRREALEVVYREIRMRQKGADRPTVDALLQLEILVGAMILAGLPRRA